MKPIVWLASYPKCGNTWLRLLLANLGQESPVDINALGLDGGIASARRRFDNRFLFASGLLTHAECDRLRPALYRELAMQDGAERGLDPGEGAPVLGGVRFIKTHDAWTLTDAGEPLLGGAMAARGAILIVRDPRDVVASLANHNGQTIDEAIRFMGDPASAFCGRTDRQSNQLRQQLLGWSGFAASWLDQADLPVHVLRYEDMAADTAGALGAALAFAGVEASPEALQRAAQFADFDRLREQEAEHGFGEAPVRMGTGRFFRRGATGGWRDELSDAQRRLIEADHAPMMARLGYGGTA
ncbi:MAG: sulfotransferase domain-containing protein [Sphingomonadales bacterium]|nr:sulfotransferase domain-containing protein [Sphingomonadales bacterium]